MRNLFEKWCKSKAPETFTDWTKRGPDFVEYQRPRVQLCWEAWQGAYKALLNNGGPGPSRYTILENICENTCLAIAEQVPCLSDGETHIVIPTDCVENLTPELKRLVQDNGRPLV